MKEIELVVDGAILACTLGTSISQLKVSSQAGVVANAKPMATVMDKIPMVNIQPFGVCKKGAYPPPCVPSPMAWEGSCEKASISGYDALLETSSIKCAMGGCITVEHSGQLKAPKVVVGAITHQMKVLAEAAKDDMPFCEECEKKKEGIRVVDIYHITNDGEKSHTFLPNVKLDLHVEAINFQAGEFVSVAVTDKKGRKYKGGKDKLTISGNVNEEGILLVKDFVIQYENNS